MADDAEIMRSHHPLHRMVLCCTSVEMTERNEIQRQCEDMGARHILDLTSEVTHLICGELFSPKYRYVAKMRPDVKVMTTKWVEAMYRQWIDGEDIDPQMFEAEHRLPVLYNLKISVTGIADVAERKRIEEICQQESAAYHPDLTYAVSHLIAAAPTGKKYEFARAHRMTVVTPEWLADSLERGMALDEKCYDPLLPPEEIGVGAKPSKSSVQTVVAEFRGKRKIRKATQDKLGGQSQSLWDDIVGQAANVKPVKRDEWEDGLNQADGVPSDKRDRRESGFEPMAVDRPVPARGGMFANACFWIWGFEDKQLAALKSALVPHDGTIVNSLNELSAASQFIWKLVVVPREKRVNECPKIPEDQDMVTVTEWWLESCLHYKKFVTPMGDFTTMPIEEFAIEDMKEMDICITNFTGIDLLYYPRLVRLLGANFHEVLRKNRSLLITNDSREDGSPKICYAHANNISVVTGEWLVECLKQHKKLSYEEYLIKPPGKGSLLGDKFKRKPETELASASKRTALESQPPSDNGSGEGKNPQQPNPSQSILSEGESKRMEGKKTLNGCTVCVSKQLKKRKEELEKIARELGAQVLATFDENTQLTHLVHWSSPGKPLMLSKEYRIAYSIADCLIVTGDWLYKCREAMARVDEKGFHPAGEPTAASKDTGDSKNVLAIGQAVPLPHIPKVPFAQHLEDMKTSFRPEPTSPRPMSPAPRRNTGENDPIPSVIPTPLAECAETRVNEISSSSSGGSTNLPERKSSNLSGISEILGKLGKDELLASSNAHKKTRGRLQGKAVAGKQRVFSRTPSGTSKVGDQSDLPAITPSTPVEPSRLEPTPEEQLVQSQALGYNYEETHMEKKIVRAKLDKSAPVETSRAVKASRVQKPRGAVDLVPTPRRSGRRSGGGLEGI